MELWKDLPVEELSANYEVSSLGRVRDKRNQRIRKQHITNGYHVLTMLQNGRTHTVSINRMVLIAFKGYNADGKDKVNHIDGDKLNNRLENLEWMTQRENIHHAMENGLIKVHTKQVQKMNKAGEVLKEYNSIQEASEEIKLTRHSIIRVLKGLNKTAGGYLWRYKFEEDNVVHDVDVTEMKPVPGYENYLVNRDGRVFSQMRKRYLKAMECASGYFYMTLSSGGKKQNRYVHTLVADAFIPRVDGKDYVNHIDKDKGNNIVANLEWVTHSENMIHAKQTP